MKKIISFIASLAALLLVLTACSSKTEAPKKEEKKEPVTVKVASHTSPMTDMLEMIKEDLKKEGYNLEIVKVSDNVQANVALNNKEVDANFFQHRPFMEQFNQKNNAHLVAIQPIYNATVAFYSKTLKDIKDLKDGADVAIPSDPTNLARALRLLDHAKVITLKDPNSFTVTEADIKDNPKNLKFVELEAAQLPRTLDDSTISVINTNFALGANLNPTKDALFLESKDSPYVNIVSVREGDEKRDDIVKLVKALQSPEIKKFIEDKYKGAILPAF